MKPAHFIAPLAALAIAGVLLGGQRVAIRKLEAESTDLRKSITNARKHGSPAENAPPRPHADKPVADKEPINWKRVAEEFSALNRDGDPKKMMSLQKRLLGMDEAELVAALDQIAALDLDEETRMKLEEMIIEPLAEKDPELALNRFKGRLGDKLSMMSWQLSTALGNWAEHDMAAATAWFDREISAGTFDSKSLDGKNRNLQQFESYLIAKMLGSNPAAAEARLSGMTPAMRMEVLRGNGVNGLSNLAEGEQAAYADLVRSQLDEQGRLEVIGGLASNLATRSGFGKVDAYLDRISASPEERRRSVEEAAVSFLRSKAWSAKLTTETIDTMREWAVKGAPEAVDRLTGEGIGNSLNWQQGANFSEASELALKYRDSTGNDDVLIGFLGNAYANKNPEEARKLAAKISDPKKREELLEKFK